MMISRQRKAISDRELSESKIECPLAGPRGRDCGCELAVRSDSPAASTVTGVAVMGVTRRSHSDGPMAVSPSQHVAVPADSRSWMGAFLLMWESKYY